MKSLLTLAVVSLFGAAVLIGCEASGEIGDNDGDSYSKTTVDRDDDGYKKTTTVKESDGDSYRRTTEVHEDVD